MSRPRLFAGKRPKLDKVEARRAVKVEGWEETFVPEAAMEKRLVEEGFSWVDDYFESSRGFKLGTRTLLPPQETLENVSIGIIYCHGYTDHLRWALKRGMLRYAEQGYLITGCELEGHGLSDGKNGLVKDIKVAVKDVHEFIKRQQERYKLKKWFIHGESMGGMVALVEVLEHNKNKEVQLDGMILLAPMCKIADEVKPPKPMVNTLIFLSRFIGSWAATPSAMNDDLVFKIKDVIKQIDKDPIRYVGKPRLKTAATMFKATVELEKTMKDVDLPFIVMHGTGDVVTTYKASEELYHNATKVNEKDKKLVIIQDACHGFLIAEAEEDMNKGWKTIFDWVNERAAMTTEK